mmetsp:Transcript_27997/g.67695  ORF Transcript_27997/g.67695 Transcript_27997/m.67695 type:complete len:145 (+) Transcript_27997:32-466(+)
MAMLRVACRSKMVARLAFAGRLAPAVRRFSAMPDQDDDISEETLAAINMRNQAMMIFPRADEVRAAAEVEEEQIEAPYTVFEKKQAAPADDEDSDFSEDEEEMVKKALRRKDKGTELGEQGFRYVGPEPTEFGDWHHKGRCTDF